MGIVVVGLTRHIFLIEEKSWSTMFEHRWSSSLSEASSLSNANRSLGLSRPKFPLPCPPSLSLSEGPKESMLCHCLHPCWLSSYDRWTSFEYHAIESWSTSYLPHQPCNGMNVDQMFSSSQTQPIPSLVVQKWVIVPFPFSQRIETHLDQYTLWPIYQVCATFCPQHPNSCRVECLFLWLDAYWQMHLYNGL